MKIHNNIEYHVEIAGGKHKINVSCHKNLDRRKYPEDCSPCSLPNEGYGIGLALKGKEVFKGM